MAEQNINFGALGMDLETSLNQVKKGKLTYALNAMIEGPDGQYVSYQNEQGNEGCLTFPVGYKVIGRYVIYEQDKIIYWLVNPETGDSEIGSSIIDQCEYSTIINGKCLNFDLEHPVKAAAHRIDNCSTQIFWVDGYNKDRFLDLNNLPYQEVEGANECNTTLLSTIDCNKLSINPFFSIPQLRTVAVESDGKLQAGTFQFAIQYANVSGDGYTSFYSVTNPVPIYDENAVTRATDYTVGKSIVVDITELDRLGYYDYFNLAVIKTVNNLSTVDMVGTYSITGTSQKVIYTGQAAKGLSIDDIFQKYPVYEKSNDLTTAQDVLIRAQLVSPSRISFQRIANRIKLQWQTWRLGKDRTYKDPLVSALAKGYMRDEVYPFEFVPLYKDGRQGDRFHIPGRLAEDWERVPIYNKDTVNGDLSDCASPEPLETWQVYNTAGDPQFESIWLNAASTGNYVDLISGNASNTKPSCYAGPYQYGDMAFWESQETYPCNEEIWGELSGQKIRHHKFPDSVKTHIHDDAGNIYPIGVKIDVQQVIELIRNSDLPEDIKNNISGFKIVRGNRANNKSVVAKGLISNTGKYQTGEQTYYFQTIHIMMSIKMD